MTRKKTSKTDGTPAAPPVLVDYIGEAATAEKAGRSVAHVGKWSTTKTVPGVATLVLMPGLNIVEAETMSAYADHPPVVAGLEGDEDGDGVRMRILDRVPASKTSVLELISRTRSVAALVALKEAEEARDNPRKAVIDAIDERSKLAWPDKKPMPYRAHKTEKGLERKAAKAANG